MSTDLDVLKKLEDMGQLDNTIVAAEYEAPPGQQGCARKHRACDLATDEPGRLSPSLGGLQNALPYQCKAGPPIASRTLLPRALCG
jgi:hypothetical protein